MREKSGGRCWYCGCRLPEKGRHVDHFEAIHRTVQSKGPKCKDGGFGPVPIEIQRLLNEGMQKLQHDHIDNMVPACAPCNLFKATFSIDELRREIELQIDRARRSSVNFRTAERFGLIAVNNGPVTFWFEREGLSPSAA